MKALKSVSEDMNAQEVMGNITENFQDVKKAMDSLEKNGGGSYVPGENIEVTAIGKGDLQAAQSRAAQDSKTMFQWIVVDEDIDGTPLRKVIWHIGDGVFIDAQGAVME